MDTLAMNNSPLPLLTQEGVCPSTCRERFQTVPYGRLGGVMSLRGGIVGKYAHRFVETYKGPVAFGLSRDVDEASLVVYLQKFSDDQLMEAIKTRLSDEEIHQMADGVGALLRKHLTHREYHDLFLRDDK